MIRSPVSLAKRPILILSVAALFIVAMGCLTRDQIAAVVLDRALPALAARAAAGGFECRHLRYRRVTMQGLGRVILYEPACRLRVGPGAAMPHEGDLAVYADHAGVSLVPMLTGRVELSVANGTIERLVPETGKPTGQRIGEMAAQLAVPVPIIRPQELLALLREEVQQLAQNGHTRLPLALTAVATVRVGDTWHDLRIRSQPTATGTRLMIDREDLARLGRSYATPLTEAEITLVSANPVRAPTLLRMSQAAEVAASVLKAKDSSFPDDAYRHVYWSYVLTLEYGPEFAERVTDAHEEGATYEFGDAQRVMDLQNNAVGRRYALAGVAASEIAERVSLDPAVIRSLRDVSERAGEAQ